MREAYRLHQFELAHSVDLVLVARQSINEKEFVDVERVYLKLLREANLLKPDETVIGQ